SSNVTASKPQRLKLFLEACSLGGHGLEHINVAGSAGVPARGGIKLAPLIGVHFQRGDERLLRDVDAAEAPHLLFSRLLLVEQLALARDVAAIAFRRDVLAHSA